MRWCVLVHGHDTSWAPPDAVVDPTEAYGQPVALVESDDPGLQLAAMALGERFIVYGPRDSIVRDYLDGVDPGRCSVRRDLLAACDAVRNGTHAEKNAALDALLASVRD